MSGNMAGDGYQNGGALVVGKNGETLFHFVQEGAPDHASNLDLLKVNMKFIRKNHLSDYFFTRLNLKKWALSNFAFQHC